MISGHNPILTPEKKQILGITMPRPVQVLHTTILPPSSESQDLEDFSSSTLSYSSSSEPPKHLLQTQWFPGEGILPQICSEELNANISAKYVMSTNGTVMISIVTKDPYSAAFVVNRIKQAKLISGTFSIGEFDFSVYFVNNFITLFKSYKYFQISRFLFVFFMFINCR